MTRARHTARASMVMERLLFVAAGVLLAWVAWQDVRRQYYAALPVPMEAAAALPGDAGRAVAPSTQAARPAPGTVLARLSIPALHLDTSVLEGSMDETLARSAGHIEETPLPGEPGNVGIAGHRDTTFRALRDVRVGDRLALTTTRGIRHYRVRNTWVVAPEEVWVLEDTQTPAVTLVTCYPFTFLGHAPQRFIVRATEETGTPPAHTGR